MTLHPFVTLQAGLLPERVPLGLTLDELCAEEREVLLQLGALRAVLRVAERVPVGHLVLDLKLRSPRSSITLFYHTISLFPFKLVDFLIVGSSHFASRICCDHATG